MKLLCFQAKHFRWKTYSKTLVEVADQDADEQVADAIVIFVHGDRPAIDWMKEHAGAGYNAFAPDIGQSISLEA